MKFETQSGCKLLYLSLRRKNIWDSLSPTPIMLCCSALKIHLLSSILHGTCSIHFIQTIILECINESTNNLYHTMTVLLEYIDRSLQFSINA